jgi:hypothetical protein
MARYGTTPSERATMARSLATLFAAGATLVLATLALPHRASTDAAALASAAAIAYVVAALLLALAGRASIAVQQVLLACGSCLIGVCVAFGGASASASPLMYLWVALFAYFFFSPVAAGVQTAVIGASLAGAFALQDGDTPVPGIHWLMALGAVGVGGVLLGRLARAIRAQAADVSAVAQMSGRIGDAAEFAHETCAGLQRSVRADAVILLEPTPGGDGLQVTGMSGAAEAGLVFTGDRARMGLERCFRSGAAIALETDGPRGGWTRIEGAMVGWAQPVLRNGRAEAVLAVGWTRRRRRITERVRTAALLFAAQASVAMDRVESERVTRERHALEINDNIVQGLVVAKYTAPRGDLDSAVGGIDETLARARALITDQLRWVGEQRGGGLQPGDLARDEASSVATGEPRAGGRA